MCWRNRANLEHERHWRAMGHKGVVGKQIVRTKFGLVGIHSGLEFTG